MAFIKNEKRGDPLDLLGIDELVSLIDDGKVDLFTSTITIIEVLESSLPSDAKIKFQNIFDRKNFHLVDVSREIVKISHEIRSHYFSLSNGSPIIDVPDVIHLSTAINQGCGKLYTFDGTKEKEAFSKLLSLPVPIIGKYRLSIEKPAPGKLQLPIEFPTKAISDDLTESEGETEELKDE